MDNQLLQVAHEQHIARLEPPVVQGVVVGLAEDGARAHAVGCVEQVEALAEAGHELGRVALLLGADGLVQRALRPVLVDRRLECVHVGPVAALVIALNEKRMKE